MKVKCNDPKHPDCKYEWEYNGKSKYFATCPGCNSKIRIKERVLE